MKPIPLITGLLLCLTLGGCVALVDPMTSAPGNNTGQMCPPGQAKKGNCMPDGGFCPPGQQKKGGCITAATPIMPAPVQIQVR